VIAFPTSEAGRLPFEQEYQLRAILPGLAAHQLLAHSNQQFPPLNFKIKF